ncbi:MAG: hypothetical protein HY815_31945 [Candidatus Riflebacteria bacterium]|nr:hypothetical protein [Candidatus Riflebacteria bacterium]
MIICKICGVRIADQVACCSRCFTPHHYDCWTFNGQCSIYACGCREHQYFDFSERSEAEVLAAISQGLALAIREELQVPAVGGQRSASGPPTVSASPAAPVGASAGGTARTAQELLVYKRGLFRSLHAVLQKIDPDRALADPDVSSSMGSSIDDVATVPALFIADELSMEEPSSVNSAMDRKRKLLHALAVHSADPPPRGLWERFLDFIKRLFR